MRKQRTVCTALRLLHLPTKLEPLKCVLNCTERLILAETDHVATRLLAQNGLETDLAPQSKILVQLTSAQQAKQPFLFFALRWSGDHHELCKNGCYHSSANDALKRPQ